MRSPAPAPAPGPAVLPGALSPLTADLVRGPRRPAAVLAVARAGVYLGVGHRVLPVLASDALALPGALRLAVRSRELTTGATPGDVVVVGAGAVRLPGLLVRGVRTWRPARVGRGAPVPAALLPGVRAALSDAVADAPGWLADALAAALATERPAAPVGRLVGRGAGLTPSGDDALAGALLVRRALGLGPRSRVDPLVAAVRARLPTTTAVSAALLDAASDGWATPEAVALAEAVGQCDAEAAAAALPPVLAVGHTSGRDLVTGMVSALDAAVRAGRAAA